MLEFLKQEGIRDSLISEIEYFHTYFKVDRSFLWVFLLVFMGICMPYKSRKPCAHPGCTELVTGGYCQRHARAVPTVPVSEADKAKHRLYDRRWQKARERQLEREPWCIDCLRANTHTPATDVHHEERHQGDRVKFWRSPLVSLCHGCHSRRTAEEVGFVNGGRGTKNV